MPFESWIPWRFERERLLRHKVRWIPINALLVLCDIDECIIVESLIKAGLVQRRWRMPGRTDTMQLSASFVGKVIIEYSGIEDFDVILMALGDGK